MTNAKPRIVPATNLIEPELRALLGVFALYNFIETQMDINDPCEEIPHFERKILVRLDHPKRLGTLAREMNALPSTMTMAADQLELRKLVTRQRDPQDRRAWLLELTEKGATLRAEMVSLARGLLRETLELSEDELHIFAEISTKIHTNVQKNTTC